MADIYTLYHYVSKPILISHNIPGYPNPLHVYITKVHPSSLEVICRNAAGILVDVTFNFNDITKYECVN